MGESTYEPLQDCLANLTVAPPSKMGLLVLAHILVSKTLKVWKGGVPVLFPGAVESAHLVSRLQPNANREVSDTHPSL